MFLPIILMCSFEILQRFLNSNLEKKWWNINMESYKIVQYTGKSLSEALLFAEHGENMLCTKIVLNVRNNFCTQHVLPRFELGIFMYWTCNSMNNLSSYCGLVDAKIRASDKDLPVPCKNSSVKSTQIFFRQAAWKKLGVNQKKNQASTLKKSG